MSSSKAERYMRFFTTLSQLQSTPIVLIYLAIIPASVIWVKFVSAFALKKFMIVYNFTCSALSLYTLVHFILGLWSSGSLFTMDDNPSLKYAVGVYLVTKYIELLDTVIMILRHKNRQVSFLHVYHHSSVVLLADLIYHSYAWPAVCFVLCINSLIHVFMYLYYGQAALYADQKPSWRRYLTLLQITQFVIDLVHVTWGYFFHSFCVYGILYFITMIALFGNFYYQAYVRKRHVKKSE